MLLKRSPLIMTEVYGSNTHMESGFVPLGHGDDILTVTCKIAGPFYALNRSFAFGTRLCVGVNTIPRTHRALGSPST